MMDGNSDLSRFTRRISEISGLTFPTYLDLHRWCAENPDKYWPELLTFLELSYVGGVRPVRTDDQFSRCQFFPNVALNYTKCLLEGVTTSTAQDSAVVIVDESGNRTNKSRGDLQQMTLAAAAGLRDAGVVAGDRVVAIARNSIESIVACLASAAIGATWSSVSPELGVAGTIERFGQLSPKVLFTNTGYTLNGVAHTIEDKVREVVTSIPTLEKTVLLSSTDAISDDAFPFTYLNELKSDRSLELDRLENFPFNQPLFVMFSSGTTGAPKCIVHGAGGTLLEHVKEHRLHSGLSRQDTLLFQTSTAWMMWNWQLSALASGTAIVLYDGSVSYPEKSSLLSVISDTKVTVLGTSPAYIQYLIESGVTPSELFEFTHLRAVQSTGSVLYESQFRWITNSFKNVPVQSVSGGTDMIGCLVLGHPELPVIEGDSQCISLGIDVRVKTDAGVEFSGEGELVVMQPFPSKPVSMWNDPDGSIMHASYFEKNPGMWTHGDQIRLTEIGSPRILGRSDGTLNIRGVRIGPAEIYTVVNRIEGVRESMAVEQASPREPGGSRLVLLLVMQTDTELERPFILQLKKKLASETSRLHVPAVVARVSALPRTHNGKASEKAARDAVNRKAATNLMALANPNVLAEIQDSVPPPPE